jgi:hypothetical protein
MLDEAFVGSPAPTSSPGINTTKKLALAGGDVVFHKPFSGVQIANAIAFGQTDETPPLHEAVAWRLAAALRSPWQNSPTSPTPCDSASTSPSSDPTARLSVSNKHDASDQASTVLQAASQWGRETSMPRACAAFPRRAS